MPAQVSKDDYVPDEPAWLRYANEPESLLMIIHLNNEQAIHDPANAIWLSNENRSINAYLDRLFG